MRKTHLVLGFVGFIIFVLTGQYMHHNFNHLANMELGERALFRAGHIYILLISLVNIILGTYLKLAKSGFVRLLQIIGSSFIFSAFVLIIYSFFAELPTSTIERPLTRFSIYLILAGTLFHSLKALKKPNHKD